MGAIHLEAVFVFPHKNSEDLLFCTTNLDKFPKSAPKAIIKWSVDRTFWDHHLCNCCVRFVTNERVEPVCDFYNGGTYRIQMTVTDGQCSASVGDSAMYIDRKMLRTFRMAASFEDELEDENIEELMNNRIFVDVYPTHIQEYFITPLIICDALTCESRGV